MGLLKILHYGHPLLREKAGELKGVGARERDLIASMAETMYAARGIGLAATQVGVMDRLFVVDVDQREGDDKEEDDDAADEANNGGKKEEGKESELSAEELERRRIARRVLKVFINPELVWESEEDEPFKEGCLSIPGVEAEVYRPSRLKIAARDENFEPVEAEIGGLLARVFQHELDHLNGVLFVDKIAALKRPFYAGSLFRLKLKTREELPNLPDKYPIAVTPAEGKGEGPGI